MSESFMTNIQQKMTPARIRVVPTLSVALSLVATSCASQRPAQDRDVSATSFSVKHMPDGKQWTTENLNLTTVGSYCYGDEDSNCRRYGRLYTWESAQRGCQSLGDGWRLPTNDDWRQLAKHHGGIRDDSVDGGYAAYKTLLIGGSSGFNALLGGGRAMGDGQYARLEAHGFYWTASESDSTTAWFYNFGKGGQYLNRHPDGETQRAFSVRCVRE